MQIVHGSELQNVLGSNEVRKMQKAQGFLKYANRKIYDRAESKYVVLGDVLKALQKNPKLRVVQHPTMKDVTDETVLQAAIHDERLSAGMLGFVKTMLKI